jgi:hypothetical protein
MVQSTASLCFWLKIPPSLMKLTCQSASLFCRLYLAAAEMERNPGKTLKVSNSWVILDGRQVVKAR